MLFTTKILKVWRKNHPEGNPSGTDPDWLSGKQESLKASQRQKAAAYVIGYPWQLLLSLQAIQAIQGLQAIQAIQGLQAIQGNQIGLKTPRGVNLPVVLVQVNTFHTLTQLRIELDRLRDSLKAFLVPLSPYTLIIEHSTFFELEIKDEDVVLVVTVRHHEDNASGGAEEVSVEIEAWKTVESLKKILVNHPSGFQTPELQNYMLLHCGKLMREKETN
ncbi:hypothetical protein DVH24_002430 [Malus domestica]|uniref:Uncharacterized protein n=1 Tax=Malus domestica TaxID=3750 RepID=A0A498IGD5_MALDO|nr:hypothetical protein DVH24_002430 [Malus domestica]